MKREAVLERFFTALISGNRPAAREIVDELLQADYAAPAIMSRLFWPTLEHIQTLYRHDQMSDLSHHYATRLLRGLVDQMQLRLEQRDRRSKKVMVICGPEESEELGAQMVSDLIEADGYEVCFGGGGVANDELVAQLGEMSADVLVVFGVTPSTVPFTRLLIDRLHELGVCPEMQIVVGGGVFNRADGLAEEIGSDLFAPDPIQALALLAAYPNKRATPEQQTVGRKRRIKKVVKVEAGAA